MKEITDEIRKVDAEVAGAVEAEMRRQEEQIVLIASENYASRAVIAAAGTVLTNKYAEGYPGKRYYTGCENVDLVEELAISRLKELFGAEHANVQPHSGSQANMAVYFSVLKPGDTILAMDLAHGGHLTHGHRINFSGIFYNVVSYGVRRETELIDYEQVEKLAREHRPKIIVSGASAYPREIDYERLAAIADSAGALLMADIAHPAGLIAAGLNMSPVPHAQFVTSTTHKTLRGPRGGFILCREEYRKKVNRNVFPGIQGGPLMHIIAAKAVAFKEALEPGFREYSAQVIENARALAEALASAGYRIVTGGTDTHLLLVDLRPKNITGKDAAEALYRAGISANMNLIPFDEKPPRVTSGIRLGSPVVTTRGMKAREMKAIASIMDSVLSDIGNESAVNEARKRVKKLADSFPFYS
ncbi:MAG: serine hydroxymethyltransferase [Candidatus Tritonobacter lacicola]|nr:serine hydroxymethyltransferase [Candidatus Tritonobacter lacicola]